MRSPFLLGLSLLAAAFPALAGQKPHIKAIDALVAPYVGRDTPGIAVLVMRNGKVLHMRGYGLADIDSGRKVGENTIFDLASVSKQMTGLAAMLAIGEGKYDEDTELSTLLPVFADQPGDERPLTIGDLVHHISGFADYLGGDEDLNYGAETTNAEVLSWLAAQELDHPPGTKFEYSNSGYLTLASVIAKADGKPSLSDVLHQRIWDPLGMKSTGLVNLAAGVGEDSRATGYRGKKGHFKQSNSPTITEGDGNVLTNLEDLARYETALVKNTLLDAKATRRLFKNGTLDDGSPVDDEGSGYGFGWVLMTSDGSRYAFHSGSWMGTSTYYQRNLTSGITIIVLANGEDMEHDTLVNDIEIACDDL